MKSFKTLLLGLLAVCFVATFSSCGEDWESMKKRNRAEAKAFLDQTFQGVHQLRRTKESTSTSSNMSASLYDGFFFSSASVSGSSKVTTLLRFAWQMNDGSYAISSINIDDVRVKIDSTAYIPTVQFVWGTTQNNEYGLGHNLQNMVDNNVDHILLKVRSEDWQINNTIPLSQ